MMFDLNTHTHTHGHKNDNTGCAYIIDRKSKPNYLLDDDEKNDDEEFKRVRLADVAVSLLWPPGYHPCGSFIFWPFS